MDDRELRAVLGQNLKKYRKKRGWSQADLAENARISTTYLGDIERGNKWPYPATLLNLAKALDVEVHSLFIDEKASRDAINSEVKAQIERFLKDFALCAHKSLESSLDQSIEYMRKQYFPR
jgi:transcriptional regulator with XRE-family HTH domain